MPEIIHQRWVDFISQADAYSTEFFKVMAKNEAGKLRDVLQLIDAGGGIRTGIHVKGSFD